MYTVLVVDDEPAITMVVRDYLAQAGFAVMTAATGADALTGVRSGAPDLVVLDIGLPDRSGLDVLRELRERSRLPVIVLTARTEEIDKVVGLELGADDYVVKPFSPRELVARVRAVLRRSEIDPGAADRPVDVAGLHIDPTRHEVSRNGQRIELTPTEFDLLLELARHPGRVFTRHQLLEVLHGVAVEGYERAVDSHVKNLRRKIELDPHRPEVVLTVHGIGYRLVDR